MKRPSEEVEKLIWGYIDPDDPIEGSWKHKAFELLCELEEKHGYVPHEVACLIRNEVSKMNANISVNLFGLTL